MLALLEQWWPVIAAFLLPAILQRLGINVPFVVPKPATPTPAIPAFPTTIGNGEVVKWILDIVAKGIADGTIKLPFMATLPPPNSVSLTPEQVMQILHAQPPWPPASPNNPPSVS